MSSCTDPIASVTSAQQSAVAQQIQMTLAKKSLDVTKAIGDSVVQLLQASANLGKTLGKGESFDEVG